MTRWRSLARSKRLLDAAVVFLAGMMLASGVALVRAVTARADALEAPFGEIAANADVAVCGADVVLAVDAGPEVTAGDAPAWAAEAVRSFGRSLAGTGARLAVVSTRPGASASSASAAPDVPFVVVDGTSLAAGGALAQAADAAPKPPATAPGNWEAAQQAAADLAGMARAGAPVLVVHLVAGLPGQHQGGADGNQPTADGTAADHIAEAVAAANTTKARPQTRVVAVGVGAASAQPAALAAVSGPDVATAGTGTVSAASTDVVTVPAWDQLPIALAELGSSACAATVQVNLLADADDGTTTAKAAATLQATAGGSGTRFAPEAGDPVPGDGPAARELQTDGEGRALLRMVVPAGATAELVLAEPGTGTEGRYAMVCGAEGTPLATDTTSAQVLVSGIAPGANVNCDMRSLGSGSPLGLAHTVLPGTDVDCNAANEGADEVVVDRFGAAVTHCLTVTNVGHAPIGDVRVISAQLGLAEATAWAVEGALAPGASASRSVPATLDVAGDVTSAASAVRLGIDGTALAGAAPVHADNRATLGVVPASLAVRRGLATGSGDPCARPGPAVAPGTVVSFCFTVTNTGGTYLDQVNIDDPSLGVADLAVDGLLAPGGSATARGTATVANTVAGRIVATGRPVDADGVPTGAAEVSSSLQGLQVSQVVGTPGPDGVAVVAITVTNPGGEPAEDVIASSSTCTTAIAGPQRVADDGDDALEPGEAWVFSCEVDADGTSFSTAFAAAAQTDTTETTVAVPARTTADLRIQKRQIGDLKTGGTTTYQIRVTNNGDVTSVNTVVTDPLPAEVAFVSATTDRGSCSQAQVVVCSLGDLAPAENQEIHATITVIVQALPGTGGVTVINAATVTSSTPEADEDDNTDRAYGRVQGEAGCERDCLSTATTTETPQVMSSGGSDGGGGDESGGPSASRFGSRALAATGSDTDQVVALSMILLASGLGLVTVSRRRSQLALASLVPVPV